MTHETETLFTTFKKIYAGSSLEEQMELSIPFDKKNGYKLLAKKVTLKSWITGRPLEYKVTPYLYASEEKPNGYIYLTTKVDRITEESRIISLQEAIKIGIISLTK